MSLDSRPYDDCRGRSVADAACLAWADADADALWQHCQNAVGIARLLLHEQRPAGLVETACRTAAEYACRAALRAAGRPFPGDLIRALESLAAPGDLVWEALDVQGGVARLAATERVLGWLSAQMRRTVPGKTWGY
jgi:hypothetical protein